MNAHEKLNVGFVMPDLELFGGPKRVVTICNMLSKKGHNSYLFLDSRKMEVKSWVNGVEFEIQPYEEIKHRQFDFLFFVNPKYTKIEHLKSSRSAFKVIYILCNGGAPRKYYQKWIRFLKKDPSVVLSGNNGLWRENYRTYGLPCFNLIGGINLEQYQRIPIQKDPRYFYIIIQGRVSRKWKGTVDILETLAKLKDRDAINVVVFNTTPLQLKSELKIETHINVPQTAMKEVYSKGDLFIHYEDNTAGWSNTTAEAMACKVPVICTRYGTSDFAIHGETAFVIKRKKRDLRKVVEIMMHDRELRDKLAEAAYRKIREFSWDRLGDKIEEMMTKLISGRMTRHR